MVTLTSELGITSYSSKWNLSTKHKPCTHGLLLLTRAQKPQTKSDMLTVQPWFL